MTAEMIREDTASAPEDTPETEEPVAATHRIVRRPGALATQEELDGLDRLIAAFEKEIGPVPPEIQAQFDADLAAADTEIGRIR